MDLVRLPPRALLSSTSGQNNVFTDRAYFYDNSIDNQDAQILFRTIDGKFAKQYIEPLPTWTADIFDSVKE